MTIEEAKEFLLSTAMPILSKDYGFGLAEDVINTAISALEKQVPQKMSSYIHRCPTCNKIVGVSRDIKYCHFCGQKVLFGTNIPEQPTIPKMRSIKG